MNYERAITRLILAIVAIFALLAGCTAPDPTVSQYVDSERGVVCYTYGQGISCVRER